MDPYISVTTHPELYRANLTGAQLLYLIIIIIIIILESINYANCNRRI